MIAVIDYDAGNIKSVEKALEYLGAEARLTRDEKDIFNRKWLESCTKLLKPNGTIWICGTYHNIFSVDKSGNGAFLQTNPLSVSTTLTMRFNLNRR